MRTPPPWKIEITGEPEPPARGHRMLSILLTTAVVVIVALTGTIAAAVVSHASRSVRTDIVDNSDVPVPQEPLELPVASPSPSPSRESSPGSPPSAGPSRAAPTPSTAGRQSPPSAESAVVAIVNSERAKAGCQPLAVDSRLTTAARRHSQDMATRDYFAHNTPEGVSVGTRVTSAGYRWSMVGENIAAGQRDAAAVMRAWMDSDGHRANILNCRYRHLGVGLAYGDRRMPYWTQDFGSPAR